VSCHGSSDGAATVSPVGGVSPYTYNWSNGQTTATATGLAAGSYTVTTTDDNGCSATASVTVTQPSTVTATISSTQNVLCNGQMTGQATILAIGGTQGFSYIWSVNGFTGPIATGLAAGNYTVTVYDANNCLDTVNFSIDQPQEPFEITASVISNYNGEDISCFGASDGQAEAIANGGVGPYSFSWSNGLSGVGVNNLSAGIYTVSGTDANGCSDVDSVNLFNPAELLTSIGIVSDVSCYGYQNGVLFVSVFGGTGSYNYLWSNGSVIDTASSLSAGSYTVTVTDQNGCEVVSGNVILNQPDSIQIVAILDTATCGLSNGAVDVTVSGGTSPYYFNWSNGSTSEDIIALNSGIYSLTVTDNKNCQGTFQAEIIQNNRPINIEAFIINNICYQQNTGSIALIVDNATYPLSYNWSNGASSQGINNLSNGIYQVTVTSSDGCTASQTFNIQNNDVVLSLDLESPLYGNGYNVSDFGASDGAVISNVNGGVPAYTYNWSNGSNDANLSTVAAGEYTLTVTDNNGCVVIETITLLSPGPSDPIMPEGISPNTDGKNEIFVIRNIEYFSDNTLYIFNRWGEELLALNGYNNTTVKWEGLNKNGNELPEGTYFAILVYAKNGSDKILKGHVDIRR
jgi:gliding motility-associated-like protein